MASSSSSWPLGTLKAETVTGQQSLLAPLDGVVEQLKVHTIGGGVTPAEPLMVSVLTSSIS